MPVPIITPMMAKAVLAPAGVAVVLSPIQIYQTQKQEQVESASPEIHPIFQDIIQSHFGEFAYKPREGGWSSGTYREYTWSGKIFDEPSDYGIRHGRISKLDIYKNGKLIYRYDRGDIYQSPTTDEDHRAVGHIIREIEEKVK